MLDIDFILQLLKFFKVFNPGQQTKSTSLGCNLSVSKREQLVAIRSKLFLPVCY